MNYKTIEKGYIGQLIVEKKFLNEGWILYRPILENGKIDLIAEKDNKYIRIQIKTTQTVISGKNNHISRYVPLCKVSHNMGQYKIHRYTKEEIDYFIGVDVDTEDLYILPISVVEKFRKSIALSTAEPWKNNFEQLTNNSST